MTRLILCLTLCLGCSVSAALAQDDAKAAKLQRFLEASGRAEAGKAMLQHVLDKAGDELPKKVVEAAWKLADLELFQRRLRQAYADLDEPTLDAAIAFYQTDAGKQLAKAQAKHDATVQAEARAWLDQIDRAVKGRFGVSLYGSGKPKRPKPVTPADSRVAIGALKTLNTAQALFREGDKDLNGEFDYAGALTTLGALNLIDQELASGKKAGYRFEICTGSEAPEFLWMAIATPLDVRSGQPHMAMNQSGVIYYSNEKPFALDRVKCVIPKESRPVGR